MKVTITIIICVMMGLFAKVVAIGGTCGEIPIPGPGGPGMGSISGEYTNRSYCYGVRIPENIIAYGDGIGGHGFGLLVPAKTPGYIYIDGSANSYDNIDSPEQMADLYIKWKRKVEPLIQSVETTPTSLGQLRAVRLVIKYKCSESSPILVEDYTIALSPNNAIVYVVNLLVSESVYPEAQTTLEKLLRTWKHLVLSDNPRCGAPENAGKGKKDWN
jgi:hypothetical protein